MENYKEVIKAIMKEQRYNNTSFAAKLGVTRAGVSNALSGPCGMTMNTFLQYCDALGAKVIVEWQDPMDKRRNFRWHISGTK